MAAETQNSERDRLLAQSTEIATLAGGLAHEIRNPLSTMRMHLELLAEDLEAEDTSGGRRMLNRVAKLQHECHNLEDVLNAFLQFARAGELNGVEGDLNELVAEYAAFLEPQAEEAGIDLRLHLDSALPRILMDRALMRQALANLCRNALQAMESGGHLEFLTREVTGNAVLEVIDTGPGMNAATREKMFQAFFSTRSGGSGLGLPTVRRIVEAHRGSILCESELGRGTRFRMTFPGISDPAKD